MVSLPCVLSPSYWKHSSGETQGSLLCIASPLLCSLCTFPGRMKIFLYFVFLGLSNALPASASGLEFLVKFSLTLINYLFCLWCWLGFCCCCCFLVQFVGFFNGFWFLFFSFSLYTEYFLNKHFAGRVEQNGTEFQSRFSVFSRFHIDHNRRDSLIKFHLIIIFV